MGHEFVGEIVSLGSVYTDKQEPVHPYYETLAVGDVVVSPFTTSCGLCQ
jgi:threonine dehydrogenase-like Zn-dependent dehydrogenase